MAREGVNRPIAGLRGAAFYGPAPASGGESLGGVTPLGEALTNKCL
jgi:hypothetical protein